MNGPSPAYATTSTACMATLDGSNEVPSVTTDGTGEATIEFNPSNNELSWTIEFSDLSGPATAAHFHGPAAEGTNAGVQVNIGDISGLDSPMEGSTMLTAEQASSLMDGMLYINIHTTMNPNGEIRGQVSCESDSTPSPTPSGGESTAQVVIGQDEFDVPYTITGGTLDELTADPATQTLMFNISSTSDGMLTVWLPKNVISADDDEFSVFVDDESGNVAVDELEEMSDGTRVLQIGFDEGAENIEVVGTAMAGGEEPEPTLKTVAVEIDGKTYQVSYNITGGSVQSASSDTEAKSVTVAISSISDGSLTVWLPKNVIDADNDFSVSVDGQSANFTEMDETADARVLMIPFVNGAENIEIMGTFIVPEFGAIMILMASIAIVGTIIAASRLYKFGGLRP